MRASGVVASRRRHVVLVAVGLLAAGLASVASPTPARASGERYVALGDSFTAGPLIPNQLASPAGCLRSDRNYPHVVASQLGLVLHDPSCSGAETGDMTSPQGVTPGPNAPQFDSLTTDTDIVTIGIGGNDIGFSSIIQDCVAVFFWVPVCRPKYVVNGVDALSNRIAATAPKVASVLRGIHGRSPHARVFVVGYPAILPETGGGCWPSLPLANDDVPWLRDKEKELNAMLATQAAANGASYVDTYAPSIGRDACKPPGVRWVEPIIPDGLQAAPVHPNALGEAGMAMLVAARINATAPGSTGVSGTVGEAGSGVPVAGAWVALLRASDFSVAGGAVANAGGDFAALVPAGSYYLYLVDPAGGHTAGFFGPPTVVTVVGGAMVDADPAMASTRGAITGTVTDSGSGAPIAGAWAVTLNGATGSPEIGAVADASGQFTVAGLSTGNHFVGYVDPAGGHATQFHPHSPDVPGAAPVAVTAAGAAVANGSLPAQSATLGGAALSGTVVEAGTSTPLAGVFVVALRAADYRIARGALTNAAGQYNLDVQAGGYKLAFIDAAGRHNTQWHDNQPPNGLAAAATVTAPAVTGAALTANTGTMAGTIIDDPATTPVPGAWAMAIGPTGITGGAVTNTNGTYTLPGLPVGTYRATFLDPNGGRTQEYWDNSPTYPAATTLNITTGATTTINAALHHP